MGGNDGRNRIDEFLRNPESPRYLGSHTQPLVEAPFSSPQAYSKPPYPPYVSSAPSRSSASRSSTSWASESDKSSRRSSNSSAPSSGPPWQPNLNEVLAMAQFDYGYDLPCEFIYSGCHMRFYPGDFEAWISHSISHFGEHPPPLRTICTFCDQEFDCTHNPSDAWRTWKDRMVHIGAHFGEYRQEGVEVNHGKPDFWTLEYMSTKHLITAGDYAHAIRYSQRPPCDNLYPLDYKTPEMQAREERNSHASYDLRKENRNRRKEERGSGRRKGMSKTH
ncbi:hypothetical protein LHYA1_G004107 [Lachnellula hyalina]|uniref:Uncharacterized protein n=1 Tax=Lachnellula hyalina TaxID=1316788 RepID=A0A8H8TY08_9HELO|nr:uncharacterized protein LHYA1_G004107 [Lachnellula hyalina]TVY26634.1 hypothetical protein LHYA1_G004107 [Lachnellula hyalina]